MMGAGWGSGAMEELMEIEYNIEYGIDIDIDQTWIRWETIVYIQYIQYSIIFKYNHE